MHKLDRGMVAMRNLALTGAALIFGAPVARAEPLTLTSPDLAPGARVGAAQVGDRFGCDGLNRSRALIWSDAPAGAKSIAISLFDPDAPTGAGFWHWMIFDIPPSATSLAPGAGDPQAACALDGAMQAKNDAGAIGYFGPCSPEGDKPHRYGFEVDALDVATLGLKAGAAAATVAERLRRHTVAKATLIGTWGR
jgi:Raf kinase inhibitor-like YbhB/YbcL family protein